MVPNVQGEYETGTVIFNAGGTGSGTFPQDGTFSFNWAIAADTITNTSWSGSGHAYTTLVLTWEDGEVDILYGTNLGNGSYLIGGYTKDTNNADAIISVNGSLITEQ